MLLLLLLPLLLFPLAEAVLRRMHDGAPGFAATTRRFRFGACAFAGGGGALPTDCSAATASAHALHVASDAAAGGGAPEEGARSTAGCV